MAEGSTELSQLSTLRQSFKYAVFSASMAEMSVIYAVSKCSRSPALSLESISSPVVAVVKTRIVLNRGFRMATLSRLLCSISFSLLNFRTD